MKSYLSMIPISAKRHRRQNRMTILCIVFAVFLVTAVFSMAEMAVRQETDRLIEKHGTQVVTEFFASESFQSLLPIAAVLFLFVLAAGVLMIAGSLNSSVSQRTQLFGMMRCIGMSRRQMSRYVRLEALNWCKTAVPIGLGVGTAASWVLCAMLKYAVGGEWADMPQLKISILGILAGALVGILSVLIAAGKPARKAANISPVAAISEDPSQGDRAYPSGISGRKVEKVLGIRHASKPRKNLILVAGSFALSIILFFCFSVAIDLVNCLLPQSASNAQMELYAAYDGTLDVSLRNKLSQVPGVKRAFGRRASFGVAAECESGAVSAVDLISFEDFDLDALKTDGMLEKDCRLDAVKSSQAALIITDDAIAAGETIQICDLPIEIAGHLKYDPFSADGSTEGKTTLIVSDKTYQKLTGSADYTMILIQLSRDAAEETAEKISELTAQTGELIDCRDNDNHGTYIAFLLCAYSFLFIIAMVTILNIVNCISMSAAARMKQYGVLRAIGMSKKQTAGMIRSEALTYAISGCVSGTVLGVLLSKWLYGFLITSHFSYAKWQLPIAELAVVLVFFFLSVAAGTYGPIKKVKSMSVTETLFTIS